MQDADIRGRLLWHFYSLRHSNGGIVPVTDTILAPESVEDRVIFGVCQQLADVGLIQLKPLRGVNGIVAAMAQITGKGVAAVEAGHSTDIDIRFPSMNGITPRPTLNKTDSTPEIAKMPKVKTKVFVVHGHDGQAKAEVARFIEKLGFTAIILHEQASKGRTIIEKVESVDDVDFAVVLLTPDDVGNKKGEPPQARARQNVILELGYFVGRLGRDGVCALRRGDVEVPSDFDGVIYETYDDHGAWKSKLAKELEAAGFIIDWPKLYA